MPVAATRAAERLKVLLAPKTLEMDASVLTLTVVAPTPTEMLLTAAAIDA
jgi:hypothetical protein